MARGTGKTTRLLWDALKECVLEGRDLVVVAATWAQAADLHFRAQQMAEVNWKSTKDLTLKQAPQGSIIFTCRDDRRLDRNLIFHGPAPVKTLVDHYAWEGFHRG